MSEFQSGWGNQLLTGFVEVAQPTEISWWPQTIGWQLLALALLSFIIVKAVIRWREYKADQYRRDALSWLQQLPAFQSLDAQPIYRQLPALLRQVAITTFGRERVCLLDGKSWETWLDKHSAGTAFSREFQSMLHALAYAPDISISPQQMESLIAEIRKWIKYHRGQHD